MEHFWAIAAGVDYVVVPFFVASVLRNRREPMAMLAWIFAIIFLPYVGMILYWVMGSARVVRRARRRRRRVAHLISKLEHWAEQRVGTAGAPFEAALPDDLQAIARIGRRLADMPAVGGNVVTVYEEANQTYAAIADAIRAAQRHVHLEYYIWQPDATGLFFRDLLVEKARAGVECRVLLDSVGCWKLNRRFLAPWVEAGVRFSFFLPLFMKRKRYSLHLRNHRKIVVVDGRVGFIGSQNIGDEYRGRLRKLSPWYDAHLRVEGPAALFLQRTFAEDWLFATRENIAGDEYFPEPRRPGRSIVQIMPTGPDQNVSPLEQVVFAAVASARGALRIATPYFVPPASLRMGLTHACSRGVKVELVLPTRSDALVVLWAGRSFYQELLEAGVKIYEYGGGVLHSKIATVDDRWSIIGSANMDVRSFRLNFEVTALVFDEAVTRELSSSIDRYCNRARIMTLKEERQRPLHQQLLEGSARLLTPLL